MAMLGGVDVVVANDESTSAGSGLKLELYNADKATLTLPVLPTVGSTTPPYRAERPCTADDRAKVQAARLVILRDAARRANAYGGTIVSHVTTNGKAKIVSESCGKTPDPNDPDTPIVAPASPVLLTIE